LPPLPGSGQYNINCAYIRRLPGTEQLVNIRLILRAAPNQGLITSYGAEIDNGFGIVLFETPLRVPNEEKTFYQRVPAPKERFVVVRGAFKSTVFRNTRNTVYTQEIPSQSVACD
jgi:hypothetical protein